MIDEIKANAEIQKVISENHPMTIFKQETRNSDDVELKRLEFDFKIRMRELDLQEKKQNIDELETRKNIAIESVEVLTRLNGELDPVTKLFFTDIIKNTSSSSSNLLAIESSAENVQERRLMNPISDIYLEVNNKPGDNKIWSRIGKLVAKDYRRRYNEAPIKAERFIAGTTRMVNVYCLKDDPWIKDYCLDL